MTAIGNRHQFRDVDEEPDGTPEVLADAVIYSLDLGALLARLDAIEEEVRKVRVPLSYVDELYDLVDDPWEMRNLIDVPYRRDVKLELAARLREHMVRLGDPILGAFDSLQYLY